MRVLVTGATGFIGCHVVECLSSYEKYEIITTGARSKEEAEALFPVLRKTNYIAKNLNQKEDNYYTFFGKPDCAIHLSWEGLPNYNEIFQIELNLPSNFNFIKNMIQNGLPDITVAGTCFEYGLQNGCLCEDMDTKPVTYYGLAKDCLRKFVAFLQSKYHFSFKWLRLFYPFGSGQGVKSLFGQMTDVISNNGNYFNMSMGEQIRDYLSVETMSEYIVAIALQTEIDGIINCCSGKPVSVRSFVEVFFEQHNYPVKLNLGYYPYPDYEPLAFWGDTGKLKKIIGNM